MKIVYTSLKNIILMFLLFRRKNAWILFRQTLSMVAQMLFLKLQEQNLLSVLHGNAQGQMQS